jgi:hypothetical protein
MLGERASLGVTRAMVRASAGEMVPPSRSRTKAIKVAVENW